MYVHVSQFSGVGYIIVMPLTLDRLDYVCVKKRACFVTNEMKSVFSVNLNTEKLRDDKTPDY